MKLDSAVLVFLVVCLGALLFWLARWARKTSGKLKKRHGRFAYDDFPVDLRQGRVSRAISKAFLGEIDALDARVGRVLAAAIVFVVLAVLLSVLVALAWVNR